MERKFVVENRKTCQRLRKLVVEISDDELQLVIYKEGWTIASALAHLAFWDQWSLLLLRKWKESGDVAFPPVDWDTINDTLLPNDALLPFLLAIPPRRAANMAVVSAEAHDLELESTPPEMITEIESLNDETRLYRSIHRNIHLNEIDTLLKSKRGSP